MAKLSVLLTRLIRVTSTNMLEWQLGMMEEDTEWTDNDLQIMQEINAELRVREDRTRCYGYEGVYYRNRIILHKCGWGILTLIVGYSNGDRTTRVYDWRDSTMPGPMVERRARALVDLNDRLMY